MPKTKRMRLPNGFGQISKINNAKLRKPYRVMITVGKSETGRPICKLLKPEAYFKTYNEAYLALAKYHENPYDISENTTINEVFQRWYKENVENSDMSKGNKCSIKSAWMFCSSVYKIPIKDIRIRHIKYCFENGVKEVNGSIVSPNSLMQRRIKSVFNRLFDYAIEYDLINRNLARDYKLPKDIANEAIKVENEHISYSDEEIMLLWKNINDPVVEYIIVQCYSGWRPQELLDLRTDNVDINKMTFTGGMKTDSGKNRTVPIHSAIQRIILNKYNQAKLSNSEYLFTRKNGKGNFVQWSFTTLSRMYKNLIQRLNLNPKHRPHDGRKHFVTLAKKYNLNEYAIKRIVGHSINDVTEKVYTERDPDWLRNEIEKIKVVVGID